MAGHFAGHILTMNQVRDNIKTLREAALHQRAEIHFGERGADEVVLVSATTWAALKAKAHGVAGPRIPTAGRRASKQLSFVDAILAGGTFIGPSDLSEHVDDYLVQRKSFSAT
jgi:hypothetical protein